MNKYKCTINVSFVNIFVFKELEYLCWILKGEYENKQ